MRHRHTFMLAFTLLAVLVAPLAAQNEPVAVGKEPVKRAGKIEENSPKAKLTVFSGKEIQLPAQTHQFKLKAGKRYRVSMTSDDLDSVLAVVDGAGNVLAIDDDSGGGLNSLLKTDIFKDGTYNVHAASLKGTGNYNLEIREDGDVKILEVGKGFEAKGKLAPALAVTYNFKLQAGKTYVIDMVSEDAKALDPFLKLLDTNAKKLAEDDDGGGDLNARITFRPETTGTYQIVATSFAPGRGGFTLTVREESK